MANQTQKHSTSPGPRARGVSPAARGDDYSVIVDQFWVVKQLLWDEQLLLVTRAGRRHTVLLDDPNLRSASWWECWAFRWRFCDA